MNKYVIFHVDGGIGKNIQATSVAHAIAEHHPDRRLIVVASWLEPWIHNPKIWRYYRNGITPYFHEDFIQDQDTVVYRAEPYHSTGYHKKQTSLPEAWCDMIGVPFKRTDTRLYFNQLEVEEAKCWLQKNCSKPIMLLQTSGGSVANPTFPFSWFRDIPAPIAQRVVDHFKHKYNILHIGYQEQYKLQDVFSLSIPLRNLMSLFPYSEKRLFMDSFSQHAAAALNLPSVTCWIANSSKVFGYSIHKNIHSKIDFTLAQNFDGYLDAFGLQSPNFLCPSNYDLQTVLNVDEIIAAVEAQH